MTSFRQYQANRLNSLKSTGPTTDAGKQRAHSRDRDQSFQAMVITVSMGS